MKYSTLSRRFKQTLGAFSLAAMLLFTSCANEGREATDTATTEVTTTTTEYEQTSPDYEQTSNVDAERNYDITRQGTAATNRRAMETPGMTMTDEDYNRVSGELESVNQQIREVLSQYPDVVVRYTDDYVTPDYSYGYYGVYYENAPNENVRQQLQNLEKQRSELENQMRGKMDTQTNVYTSAEQDAVPKVGYDELYDFIQDKISYPNNAAAAGIEGTIFVDFVVDANGNVINPSIAETIQGQRQPEVAPRNPTRVGEDERREAIRNMEQQAIEAVKATSGMWEPATMSGAPVAEEVTLPVRFRMNDR